MTGCVTLRKDIYYVRLSYYDKDHIRKDKFVSTGISGRGAKQKAIAIQRMGLFFPASRVEQAHFSPLTTCLTTWGDFWLILRHLMYLFIIDTLTKLR